MRDKARSLLTLALLAIMVNGVSATSLFDTTALVDTIQGFGDVLAAVADIVPDIQDILIAFAVMAFVVGFIAVLLGFIAGILNFEKLMKMVSRKK